MINLTVNGKSVVLPEKPGEMLVDLLRERLDLTGTKVGCNEAECGACTVLVDGQPVLSCTYPAAKAAGKEVQTIEGLAEKARHPQGVQPADPLPQQLARLHPLQQAFI